ncbi:VOC family protein [Legionella londiniensis]|uniref:Glyoxylase n=1 Tax=Legionella londiniensis TaxID=45068 RepID=A0A0W0VJS2_9GAMM|nr:VOC family protein [Legionella londiniensis]KTD20357.1 glyoxylase [Legionella londiniensis]STX93960.1 glycoxylase [Legionella londiniensis]
MTDKARNAGEIGWNRLLTVDVEQAKDFYHQLFGWETIEVELDGITYFIFKLGNKNIAGLMWLPPAWQAQDPRISPHWMSYITVENIQEAVSKAVRHGAKLVVAAKTIQNLGMIAMLQDPTGAYIGLFQPILG